jgi:hypothetical protein
MAKAVQDAHAHGLCQQGKVSRYRLKNLLKVVQTTSPVLLVWRSSRRVMPTHFSADGQTKPRFS